MLQRLQTGEGHLWRICWRVSTLDQARATQHPTRGTVPRVARGFAVETGPAAAATTAHNGASGIAVTVAIRAAVSPMVSAVIVAAAPVARTAAPEATIRKALLQALRAAPMVAPMTASRAAFLLAPDPETHATELTPPVSLVS